MRCCIQYWAIRSPLPLNGTYGRNKPDHSVRNYLPATYTHFTSNSKAHIMNTSDIPAISNRIAELESAIALIQVELGLLLVELKRLKRRRANIKNGLKRKPKTARDNNICLAYEFLTGAKINPKNHQSCIDLGIKYPPPNLSPDDATLKLAHAVGVCTVRILQIIIDPAR
jgi:hypothetical protein